MTVSPTTRRKPRWLRAVVSVIACVGVLAASVGAVVWINRTEPTAQTINSKRRSAALVETVTVQRGTHRPTIAVLGTVQAAREVSLSSRVGGQVMELAPQFVPGGMVESGDLLLRIDPADYENALSISGSELEQAEASLAIELGRQSLAKKELKLLEGTIDSSNRALVLREPQMASIRAEVKAAEAAVERAQLDLDRTRVVAPFDAQVLTRLVNVGSQISPGDELGRLVGTEQYWVSAAVPVRSLRWIEFDPMDVGEARSDEEDAGGELRKDAGLAEEGSAAILRDTDAWGPDSHRSGTVSRMIGALDEQTRLARVLITVPDPLGRSSGLPPLILDSLVDVEIKGRPIENVVRLPRNYLRDTDTLWIMQNGELQIRDAEVVFRDANYAYVREGLEGGEEVITTTLATVAEGVRLRKRSDAIGDNAGAIE